MVRSLPFPFLESKYVRWFVIGIIPLFAILIGFRSSLEWLLLLVGGMGGIFLLKFPEFRLPVLIIFALLIPVEFNTGTDVSLNMSVLLLPLFLLLWIVKLILNKEIRFIASYVNIPLLLFLVAGLISLLIGNATWDPTVPRSNSFILVQLAQWAVFAFSACAFWLTANTVKTEKDLKLIVWTFLIIGGSFAILSIIPFIKTFALQIRTLAFIRAPFWALLTAMVVSQLLFNDKLINIAKVFLFVLFVAILFVAFVEQKESASNWIGVVVVISTLIWLRWPQLRWGIVAIFVLLAASGFLFSALWELAGGDAEWFASGGSRIVLGKRVIELTMRNPWTGLGPAAYRPYGVMQPLIYEHIVWFSPRISSHNNYIDIFAHTGILGLLLFLWFTLAMTKFGIDLRSRFSMGFSAAFVNGMLATGAGSLVLMLFADWILPFVYNIGFPGFQASVLIWLFLGGLLAISKFKESSWLTPNS